MSSLGRALAAELDVVLGTRIDSLRPQADGSWMLRSDEGVDHGPYSGLVLTCPAPQSAALLGSVNPGLAAQCESVSMRPCWAVMAAFDAPVDLDFDAAFVVDDRLAWVARDSSKPGRTRLPDCWTLHATPEWSARNLETDRSVVALKLLDRLFELTGREHREASTLLAHRWRFARPAEESITRPRVEPETRLALAGDWTSGARIEDAAASGIGAADDLIEALGSRDG
jgi:predicted NAD/FAD-dependent oxidoreductase